MAAARQQLLLGEDTQQHSNRIQEDDIKQIEKKALWLKTKLREGPINGPSSLKTYREDIRQLLFREFNSPVTDQEISVVVRKAFPGHSRKGKYYLGLGTDNSQYGEEVGGRTIQTDNLKSLMTVQSESEGRDSSPVMLKPVKKRAIQAWKETENGQAFAADQMMRDANNQLPAPVVSVAPNNGDIRPQWSPMFVRLPHPLHMAPRGMLFQPGTLPRTIPIPHGAMVTNEPNNNINRGIPSLRGGRKRPGNNPAAFPKLSYGAERVGKKPRKENAMIELSSTRNGLIAERPNLAAMHIKPIILDFEVTMPKLPLPRPIVEDCLDEMGSHDDRSTRKQMETKESSLGISRSGFDSVPASPRAADSANGSAADLVNKSLNVSGDKDSAGRTTNHSADPFKKPDIENYRTNVSAGRCLLCQNPIPPNGSGTASAITICVKCTKVALSGPKSLKPVPKFPFACNPKLAPKTVYVPGPRRPFKPRPPPPTGPQKAVGIRLYPPRSLPKAKHSSTPVPSPSGPPRSPSQLSVPGSPAPSLPLGSPQPQSPLIMHSAPPSPRQASEAVHKLSSHSLPPSPSMISPQRLASPAPSDTRETDPIPRRPSISLQVPSPGYSSNPSTPSGRDSCSSERLALPPGREQDDATIKALLQLGRGVDRVDQGATESMSIPSPKNRTKDRDSAPQPYPNSSIPIPHSPISLPPVALPGNLPLLPGQVSMIPSNTGVVMGPGGQLLPIVPSWPYGLPTSEALNMLSQGVYPPGSLFVQPSLPRESSSPTSATSDLNRNPLTDSPKPSSAGSSPESPFDISQMKYRKGYKRSRLADRVSDSPTGGIGYGPEHGQEDKSKPKKSLVIVGTNCAGSSSIKNDGKGGSYHQEEGSRDGAEVYGKSFSCHCSGREIILLQCTDCDFVCNNKLGLDLHIAAQRHAESRNKTTALEVSSRHANEADDRDEVMSQSSVETQSADTDTDAASPPLSRIPREATWSRLPDTNNHLPLQSWQEKVLQCMPPSRAFHQGSLRTPCMTSRASFITAPTYGSFGTVTENTVPLDLSGRNFQAPPFLPGISPPLYTMEELSKQRPNEEPSPLDLSGYGRALGDCNMPPQFVSSRRSSTQGSMPPKKTAVELITSQQPVSVPSLVFTSSSNKKHPPPQTFFDLLRQHGIPVSTDAVTSTSSSSKSVHSPNLHTKLSNIHSPAGPSSPNIRRTLLDNPSSPKPYPVIPSIVLSSGASTPSSAPKYMFPTTELTRPPPGAVTNPLLTQPQFLNYQGGTISVRPTHPLTHTHVSSKTVPILSPFSGHEMRLSPGREPPHLRGSEYLPVESRNMHVPSPTITLGSPSMGSLNFHDSPTARQRLSAPESPREYSNRRDSSPIRSPQALHIKIEPPDSNHDGESGERIEHIWDEEAEKQERVLEASLNTSVHSSPPNSSRSGIGRTTWSITSKSLQIRDNSFMNSTSQLSPRTEQTSSRNNQLNASHYSAKDSYSGVNDALERLSSPSMSVSPSRENHRDFARDDLPAREGMLLGHPVSRSRDSLSPNASRSKELNDGRREASRISASLPASPSAWQVKVEK
ncbi:uncharacterized protein LOC117291616 isoform X2 [Asterias rubens]|uniref:uncharacterized protein LOC117291616 isoform X2 n=1 Tax=Asterias rubens TaxID=7604 RepID=UPI0014553B53|nr:uncharacterized protein LOC117291616 isoform X2 [Asterias rubens]